MELLNFTFLHFQAMRGAPERVNAHELLSEFENSVDISYIDACFAMRHC